MPARIAGSAGNYTAMGQPREGLVTRGLTVEGPVTPGVWLHCPPALWHAWCVRSLNWSANRVLYGVQVFGNRLVAYLPGGNSSPPYGAPCDATCNLYCSWLSAVLLLYSADGWFYSPFGILSRCCSTSCTQRGSLCCRRLLRAARSSPGRRRSRTQIAY
jgi:hypothetical protein